MTPIPNPEPVHKPNPGPDPDADSDLDFDLNSMAPDRRLSRTFALLARPPGWRSALRAAGSTAAAR
jgi:hypothetical protein